MLDQLNLRFKYVLAFMIGAVIAAAALRHGVHVYGGFSREEIRTDALMAIPFVALTAVFFRRFNLITAGHRRHRKTASAGFLFGS